jgi:selenocysteine lyase/cysteine desulfurase
VDLEGFRALFPALERYVWLNSPTAPPAARPVLAALRRVETEWETGVFAWQDWETEAYATREQFARLINADADSVALVPAVSYAASAVAASLPVGAVVVGAREFRSNYFPWLALRGRGHEVRVVEANDRGVVPLESLVEAIDGSTVLVAISDVQSTNGYRVDLPALLEAAQAHGARVFVDVCQSLGAIPFDVEAVPVDFLAAHGYKWMLGPRGAAWLYLRADRIEEVPPLTPSWKTPEDPYADYYGGPMEVPKSARKLDTSLAWFAWPGARAALDLLLSLNPEEVQARALGLAAAFREEAATRGLELSPEDRPSQIVGVMVPDPHRIRERLRERRIVAAVRGGFLRLGFHAFNDEDDVEAVVEALAAT